MRFECQTSCGGACCRIPKGQSLFIFLTKEDRKRIAAFIRKPIDRFARLGKFSKTRFGRAGFFWYMKQTTEDKCRFLQEGRCSIYSVRPTQCKTWPFWPENEKPLEKPPDIFLKLCPGIGVGDEIAGTDLYAEQREADGKYSNRD